MTNFVALSGRQIPKSAAAPPSVPQVSESPDDMMPIWESPLGSTLSVTAVLLPKGGAHTTGWSLAESAPRPAASYRIIVQAGVHCNLRGLVTELTSIRNS